ncbi:winged helix-turn-helix transcriptional regulator [Oleidesulfovibrio sp.]|uniref:winged helix-turn-helix transcriptional regulator n=1 Tax=Oleidesulfovibrio sp. TaxID=2909707 RepID=UPI003A88F373
MGGNCTLKHCAGRNYYCSVELTIQLIGGKWKPIILYHLGTQGTYRFGELRRSIPNITQKMLTQQLRELERDGIVDRKVYPEVPPKVEYTLSETGQTIMPVLKQLCKWGKDYEERFGIVEVESEVEEKNSAA